MIVRARGLGKNRRVHLPVLAEECGLQEGIAQRVACCVSFPGAAGEVLQRLLRDGRVECEVQKSKWNFDVGARLGVVGEHKGKIVW